jgi:myo-inositol 2-dehydrogenase/D-chiro-inositol 1-dehydrogenase
MLNVGIIGCGQMGELHAIHLQHNVQGAGLSAIMDTSLDRLQSIANACGACRTFTVADELIQDPDVDAIVIASPDHTHAELALSCLAAGKPVLCEKPMATTQIDAKRILNAEMALGRRLVQVGFMREYDESHLLLKDALSTPELGHRLMFRSRAVNPAKDTERPVDEVVTNSAIHDFHTARWLMGDEIERVYVQHFPYHPDRPETCRLMNISLSFAGGALGCILINSECGYGHEVEVEVTTERGQVNIGDPVDPVVRHGNHQSRAIHPTWRERFEAAYLTEITAWVNAVSAGSPTGPSAWDGFCSLVVSDAAKQSARTDHPESVPQTDKPALYALT